MPACTGTVCPLTDFATLITGKGRRQFSDVPEGFDGYILARLHQAASPGQTLLHVALDEGRATRLRDCLAFFAPDADIVLLPGWDCMPYDRVSPRPEIASERVAALGRLAAAGRNNLVVIATVSGILQRVPPAATLAQASLTIESGTRLLAEELIEFLQRNGYARVDTVHDHGDFALRGGIIDLFPPERSYPLRLDLFGDELESIREFDPADQRSTGPVKRAVLGPTSEVRLEEATIKAFRQGYRQLTDAVAGHDRLYEGISEGRRHPGMEQYLPLFYPEMATVFDYLSDGIVTLDYQTDEAVAARLELIRDYYEARLGYARSKSANDQARLIPLSPDRLYLTREEWETRVAAFPVRAFSPFAEPGEAAGDERAPVSLGGGPGEDFAPACNTPGMNVFDAVQNRVKQRHEAGGKVVIAAYTEGSAERLQNLLKEHGAGPIRRVSAWPEIPTSRARALYLTVLGLERGFSFEDTLFLSEQDILGDRLVRRGQRRRKADAFITEASALAEGDLVVHAEHGIGRYEGLETLEVGGAPHDCLRLLYADEARLFVPVENIEVLSRFGADQGTVRLDRLGTAAWQARSARVRERIREIAHELIDIAAARALRPAPEIAPPEGAYAEFSARFPFHETEDQERAITECLADLTSGRPMDRLICGDVGFGKTEVALRAAFVVAMSGRQVAIVTPTTLLARQHYQTFRQRFDGLPVQIGQLSRLVNARRAAEIRAGVESGEIDIVVGTHALLSKNIKFRELGLVIVDEEQHFGVEQKERLKRLRSDAHVLTLTATPIPRTLQLALSGVREMSLIATPPVDRLAVRTFIMPYDALTVREAIMREHFRGGQTFYVCPRVQDLSGVHEQLRELVPEVRVVVAHGGMGASELEDVMSAFYDGKYDVLLSTQIIESGLDIPSANTMIIHRADMFGLAQLYQLRGRIGRAKTRAYAYLTLPPGKRLTASATRRLEVFQTLDTLGAGFTLASHDLDIRGAGNLLGDEQSGHIREVGVELYQQMLEEAVANLRAEDKPGGRPEDHSWTPQITMGTPVLIPESYVRDLNVRLGLYRRLSVLVDRREIEAFAAELVDRFGTLPQEVENLLEIVAIKQYCRAAGVEKIDAGPKGAVVTFRGSNFANPDGLVGLIQKARGDLKLRPDFRLVRSADWPRPEDRVRGSKALLESLASLIGEGLGDGAPGEAAGRSRAASSV